LVATAGELIVTAVPWDTAFVLSNRTGQALQVKRRHSQRLSALAISRRFLATAARDCVVMLWRVGEEEPYSVVTNTSSPVVCLAIAEAADSCVACSKGGEVVLVALESGAFVRKVRVDVGEPHNVVVWDDGTTAVECVTTDGSVVVVFDQNLSEVARAAMPVLVVDCAKIQWPDGRNYLVVGEKSRRVAVFRLPEMVEVWGKEVEWEINRVAWAKRPVGIIVGTACGKIVRFVGEMTQVC
jgi:hypothetical protein